MSLGRKVYGGTICKKCGKPLGGLKDHHLCQVSRKTIENLSVRKSFSRNKGRL